VQLRCFITHARAGGGHLIGYAENLSRFSVVVRCVDQSSVAIDFPQPGDPIQVYVELPQQRPSVRVRCLHCIATVTGTPTGMQGERLLAASVADMQFRDLPTRFTSTAAAAAPRWFERTM
jgi:hypothetical protein